MTEDGLNDSARHMGGDMYKDYNGSHGDDSSASSRQVEQQDRASEDGESMDAPTLQADAALALAKQFQKARRAAAATINSPLCAAKAPAISPLGRADITRRLDYRQPHKLTDQVSRPGCSAEAVNKTTTPRSTLSRA